MITIFNGHLDYCQQCRDNPFDLCVVGARLLKEQAEVVAYTGLARCEVTANPCGTDTWAEGYECECMACQAWTRKRQSIFVFDR